MRIGLLSFGEASYGANVAETLRGRDIDVVTAEEPATSGVIAAREAARLNRADCDGVTLLIGDGAVGIHAAQAALHIGCPLLLAGAFTPPFFDAAGALTGIGVPFDRLLLADDTADRVQAWLTANRKTARQRGVEAAQKLYGQILLLGGGAMADVALWQRQFGITVVQYDPGAGGDFVAPDGDAEGALTLRLLRSISGAEVRTLAVGDDSLEAGTTYARLSRRSGRFVCVLFFDAWGRERLFGSLMAGRLHAAPGDHVAAIRAACEALDIEVVMLD